MLSLFEGWENVVLHFDGRKNWGFCEDLFVSSTGPRSTSLLSSFVSSNFRS